MSPSWHKLRMLGTEVIPSSFSLLIHWAHMCHLIHSTPLWFATKLKVDSHIHNHINLHQRKQLNPISGHLCIVFAVDWRIWQLLLCSGRWTIKLLGWWRARCWLLDLQCVSVLQRKRGLVCTCCSSPTRSCLWSPIQVSKSTKMRFSA